MPTKAIKPSSTRKRVWEKREANERRQRDLAMNITTPTPEKAQQQAETSSAIAAFLARGGTVTVITPELAAVKRDPSRRPVPPMW